MNEGVESESVERVKTSAKSRINATDNTEMTVVGGGHCAAWLCEAGRHVASRFARAVTT